MQQRNIQEILQICGIHSTISFKETLTSAVTTAWGVNWDEIYIARDIMQNFFDANRNFLSQVLVENQGSTVVIKAPTTFNLKRLFFIGSEKSDDDIGQYGEGFKVAATCLLRDHKVTPIAVSNKNLLCLKISDMNVEDTQLYPIEYDFYSMEESIDGTILLLTDCSQKLISALKSGLTHFFHDKNPLLGRKLWDYGQDFLIYESLSKFGHIFYRNLKRGEIDDIPLVLVINKEYKRIEAKTGKDRDRNAFGKEVMEIFFNHFAKFGLKYAHNAQEIIVCSGKHCWEKGHPFLSEIARGSKYKWTDERSIKVFGNGYFIKSSDSSDPSKQMEIERIEKIWRNAGKIELPRYFNGFGVKSAKDEIHDANLRVVEEAKKNQKRIPTINELEMIQLFSRILLDLAPEVIGVLQKSNLNYTVVQTETILGELKSSRGYRSYDVFLAESLFIGEFATALATFLHEHAHIFGYDGSRGFTDALTRLLESIIQCRNYFNEYEETWIKIKSNILNERKHPNKNTEKDFLQEWLLTKNNDDLRQMLLNIPIHFLKSFQKNNP